MASIWQGEYLSAQERAALLTWLLLLGRRVTTREVAEILGLSERGARQLLCGISRVVPIHRLDGYWQLVATAPDLESK